MTTNVIKKDWFNPITASVLVILVAISLALQIQRFERPRSVHDYPDY